MMETFLAFLEKLDTQLFDEGIIQALFAVAIIVALALLANYISGRICRRLDQKYQERRLSFGFLRQVIKFTILGLAIVGILYQVKPFRSMTTSLLAGSGIAAVFLGIASQEAMSNMVSGLLLATNRPFVTGDRISLSAEGLTGFVEEVTLRHTVLRTFNNTRVIVPNSKINTSILENYSYGDGNACNFLDVSVGYGADLDRAMAIIRRVAETHPLCMDRRNDIEKAAELPKVAVKAVGFTPYGCDLRGIVWTRDAGEGYDCLCDCRVRIKQQFDAAGIPWPRSTTVVQRGEGQQ
ncbi:MAG: mechanosensitive ion channel family protein [Eubacteriales bacterium]|nr:mechanosensitive ion channel family protein [Eubacteriales bacterium]